MFLSQIKLYKSTKLSACRTIFSVSRKYLYSNKSEQPALSTADKP
jgi:hypothetical protein